MNRQLLVDKLNEQMNREITTFLRYIIQGASIRGAENEAVREMYLSEVLDEVGHAQYLANQIVDLGGVPRVDPDVPAIPPEDVEEMLRHDSAAEEADVKRYRDLVTLADDAGLAALKLKLEEQAADEDEHGQEMRRLLGDAAPTPASR